MNKIIDIQPNYCVTFQRPDGVYVTVSRSPHADFELIYSNDPDGNPRLFSRHALQPFLDANPHISAALDDLWPVYIDPSN